MEVIEREFSNIGLFSDIHFGKSRDSALKLELCSNFVKWLAEDIKEREIDALVFGGDWFDNRNSISVMTINHAYDSLKLLAKECPVFLIVGNHDSTLKTGLSINSLRQFNDIPNVHIVETETLLKLPSCNIMMCPWERLKSIQGLSSKDRPDVLVGHFEFNGASLFNHVFDSSDVEIDDISEVSPLVFAGHFHVRKEYSTKGGKIITIGSPFELDWGDINNHKGYYSLDCKTKNYTFVRNTKSPIHIKIYMSKAKADIDSLETYDITGNYVKLLIDEKFEYDDLSKVIEKINSFNPLRTCFIEYLYTINFKTATTDESKMLISKRHSIEMSMLDYVKKYIESMDAALFDDIPRERIATIAETYFKDSEKKLKDKSKE